MKKIISIFTLILPISVLAIEIGVFDSGINWTDSKLTITEFKDINNIEQTTGFDCFGASDYTPIPLKNIFQDSSDSSTGGVELETTGCHTIGDYTFKITLVDMAGNISEKTNYKLRVFPGDADHMMLSYLNCDSSSDGVIANGNKTCDISVEVFDKFDNKFSKFNDGSGDRSENSSIKLAIPDQVSRTEFNYLDETTLPEDLFRDGIILPSSKILNDLGQETLAIKAEAPSIDIIQGKGANSQVALLTPKSINLGFEFDSVNNNGTLNSGSKNILSTVGSFKFYPWVKVDLSDPDGDSNLGLEKLEIDGDSSEIVILSDTEVSGLNLPSGLTTKLIGVPPEAVNMLLSTDNTFTTSMNLESGVDFSSWDTSLKSQIKNSFLKLTKAIGVSGLLDWGLTTKITHNINGQKITYPGGNFGDSIFKDYLGSYVAGYDPTNVDCLHCDGSGLQSMITFIGADIEGQIQSNQNLFALGRKSGQGHIIDMGGVSVKDTREKIVQNAYALYRGIDPLADGTEVNLMSGIDFTAKTPFDELIYSTGVAYYKGGTIKLGGTIKGIGTIIVVDGNIVIEDDMEYENPNKDSLGIILVNTKMGKPADKDHVLSTGNIFVRPNVQKIVGTYFADGSLLSVTSGATITTPYTTNYAYPLTMGEPLTNQLLLKGTIFSYNTLGGSEVLNEDTGKYSIPWGDAEDIDEATIYDIHHIRRYSSGAGSCVTNTNNGGGCDTNSFAFIIRPDGKIKNQTPPGFSNAAVSYR